MSRDVNCLFYYPEKDLEQNIVLETDTCYFLQKDSEQWVLVGSGLINPKSHKQNVFELSYEEWQDTRGLLLKAKFLLDHTYAPAGYSVGWSRRGVDPPCSPEHILRFEDDPYVGRGIRYWIKQPENKRKGR